MLLSIKVLDRIILIHFVPSRRIVSHPNVELTVLADPLFNALWLVITCLEAPDALELNRQVVMASERHRRVFLLSIKGAGTD